MNKYIITAAICFAASSTLFAKSDATLNNVTETYTLKSDGSIDYDYSKSMTYHTHHSFFNLFGETFVEYNPDFQKLTINECKTTQKDGNVVKAPANAFNEVLPSGADNSADFNGLREMVITHTGLEPGCTVDLSYSIKGNPDGCPTLDIDRVIPMPGADIKEYKIVVNVPEGTDLNWSVTDSNVKPVVTGNTYTWTFHNIPAAAGDAFAPASRKGMPRLNATTAGSLEEALRPLTIETDDICKVPSNVLNDKNTPEEKALAIQNFVVSNIASAKVAPELTGYNFRQCAQVISSAIATEAEKALSMAKLMRSEGLDAQAVVVYPKNVSVRDIRNISKYLVKVGGDYYNVDKPGKYTPSLRADRDDIVDLAGNAISVDPVNPVWNYSSNILIDKEGDIQVSNQSISAVPAVIGNSDDADKKGSAVKTGEYLVYTIPDNDDLTGKWNMAQLNSQRKDYFEIPYALKEVWKADIIAEGIKPISDNKNYKLENAAGSVTLSIENKGDTVVLNREISLNKSVYPPSEYNDVRKLIQEWLSPEFRKVVFK